MGRLSERNKRYSNIDLPYGDDFSENYPAYQNFPQDPQNIPMQDYPQNEQYYQPQDQPDDRYVDYQPVDKRIQHKNLQQQFDTLEHGKTKSPSVLATEIEKDPTPKGAIEINIGGRPIDLHALEDYMVWKTSPFIMKTLMRYHDAKTIEQIKTFSRRRVGGAMPMKTIFLIIFFIGMAILGFIMLMFMPQIMQFFRGFGGF